MCFYLLLVLILGYCLGVGYVVLEVGLNGPIEFEYGTRIVFERIREFVFLSFGFISLVERYFFHRKICKCVVMVLC